MLALETLGALGYEVVAAEGALEALAKLEDGAVPVQLLISDVMMPAMSGTQLATLLRDRFPALRVLFISGFSGACLGAGGAVVGEHFLAKPFLPAQLAERVREVLAAPARGN